MTSNPLQLPIPPYLQPNLKAPPTASSSQLSAVASSTPAPSRSPSQVRLSKSRQGNASSHADFTSERATTALIRHVLCPQVGHGLDSKNVLKPIHELLPSLTSSNEIDLQLYAILAIILKEFVYVWYAKITPDHAFVEEVVQIVAHCSRALEQRLRLVDVECLLFDQIPSLVDDHVVAYRTAHVSLQPLSFSSDARTVYHALNAHPALSPIPDVSRPETLVEQGDNERMYRQLLVQGALALLLPTEDLENTCLRTLVEDIIADLILGQGVSSKACEGWFIWETIGKLAEMVRARLGPKATGEEIEIDTRSRLEQFGLLCSKEEESRNYSSGGHQSQITALFWCILQYGYLTFLAAHFVIIGLARASSRPPRSHSTLRSAPSSPVVKRSGVAAAAWRPIPTRTPMLEYRVFGLISTLLDLSSRMPWLLSLFSLFRFHIVHGPGRLGETDGVLDKFLWHTLRTHALAPSMLPPAILNLRIALFPFNAPGPPRDPPSPADITEIKRSAASALLALLPARVPRGYFAAGDAVALQREPSVTSEERGKPDGGDGEEKGADNPNDAAQERALNEVEGLLDVFSDAYLNKHLVYGMLELIVVELLPEMGAMGIKDLMAERLG